MPQNEPEDSDASIYTSGSGGALNGGWERIREVNACKGESKEQTSLAIMRGHVYDPELWRKCINLTLTIRAP